MNKIDLLNKATEKYDEGHPIMSDKEWDDIYFEVKNEADAQGIYFYTASNVLKKVKHNHYMLSLDKTKQIDFLRFFINDKKCCIMPKFDGLSCSLLYKNGTLVRAETRGNGEEGEDVTHNILVMENVPKHINDNSEECVIDGEVLCRIDIFNKHFADTYSNARNFAAGSLRLLDSKDFAERKLEFWAWSLIKSDNKTNSFKGNIEYLQSLGFNSYISDISLDDIESRIDEVRGWAASLSVPIDGAVVRYDDEEYSESLGSTSHHSRAAIAYKFYDTTYETRLEKIEWTMGRMGTLTPVAIFESIEIDGAIVSRANLHNISIMTEILGDKPYQGQHIRVYRSNMVIPQVYSADKRDPKCRVEYFEIPEFCPYCNEKLVQKNENGSIVLYCKNPDCDSNFIVRLDHFTGKKGMDIKGLSKATLEKLINYGWIESTIDIFNLNNHRDEWIEKEGFGPRSVDKILAAIDKSKQNCELNKFISAIGIPLIGQNVAKDIIKYFSTYESFRNAINNNYDFTQIPNFGESKAYEIMNFDYQEADKIAELITFSAAKAEKNLFSARLDGLTFVVTGKLTEYKNRAELKSIIEENGGRVVETINKKTSYLINNDINSTSAKNLAAKKANIPILSEKEFRKKFDL